jgi:hypothetical protein
LSNSHSNHLCRDCNSSNHNNNNSTSCNGVTSYLNLRSRWRIGPRSPMLSINSHPEVLFKQHTNPPPPNHTFRPHVTSTSINPKCPLHTLNHLSK